MRKYLIILALMILSSCTVQLKDRNAYFGYNQPEVVIAHPPYNYVPYNYNPYGYVPYVYPYRRNYIYKPPRRYKHPRYTKPSKRYNKGPKRNGNSRKGKFVKPSRKPNNVRRGSTRGTRRGKRK